MARKGKEVAGKAPAGKRKRGRDDDKSGSIWKKRNREVLQFFEDVVAEADDTDASDDSDIDNYFMEEEFFSEPNIKRETENAQDIPLVPKEEINEDDFDKIMEERYKTGSDFSTFAGDDYDNKRSIERNSLIPSAKDPTIWKVKCMVGRERQSAFCLMQKYVDLKLLGSKLQIISAFALDQMKGFICIEAEKQCDINEACKGISSIYPTRVMPVPKNEVSHLFSARSKCNEVSEGTWARVKNGKYRGDLAQIVAVNVARKKATVKLIPRIDLQALAAKYGGGVKLKKNSIPAPRLMSTSELEEFRPLIKFKRDRDTDTVFEVLDGLMFKGGYLFKKIPTDSLSCWGVEPSEEELLKFKPSVNTESDNLEWLSQLYGEQKKKRIVRSDKGGGKGEGSSGSGDVNGFELYDFVCFGRKDFGVIVGMEKDDSYKILKEGLAGPDVVTIQLPELKSGPFDTKFTALDQRMKPISVTDTIKVLEGPIKGRQGIVRKIYRGIIFFYDENETENGGYLCAKSHSCEKIKLFTDMSNDKVGGESGPLGFEDFASSPKSPLSPKMPWQARENSREFNRGDKDGMFSIGQTLRIRVGPLKGYLCRVLALRHSDVTVKLDSQHKVLTVKSEHLSEVRGKSSTISMSENPESSSLEPFNLLGTEGCSRDWMQGAGTSAGSDGWNSGGLSAGRSSWPSFPASGSALQLESSSANPLEGNDAEKGVENAAWESKVIPNQSSSWGVVATHEKSSWGASASNGDPSLDTAVINEKSSWGASTANENSSWGAAAANEKSSWGASTASEKSSWGTAASNDRAVDQIAGWVEGKDAWNKTISKTGFGGSSSNNWDKSVAPDRDLPGSPKVSGDNWGKGNPKIGILADSSNDAGVTWEKKTASDNQGGERTSGEPWNKGKGIAANLTSNWGNSTAGKTQLDSWGKSKDPAEAGLWEREKNDWNDRKNMGSGWDQQNSWDQGKDAVVGERSPWGKPVDSEVKGTASGFREDSWGKAVKNWSTKDGSSGSKTDWKISTPVAENQAGDWGNAGGNQTQAGGSWNKPAGGSTWSKYADATLEDESKGKRDQEDCWNRSKSSGGDRGSSWNKQDGGSWGKPAGGSTWSKQAAASLEDESEGKRDQDDSWNRSKNSSGDQGSGGWNKGWVENKEDTNGRDSWARPKAFDKDSGFGGRRGRGGGRGGRDQFGRGRSFSQRLSGWNGAQENTSTNDGTSSGNSSGWTNDQAWGSGDTRQMYGGKSSGWNNITTGNNEEDDHKDQWGDWNKGKTSSDGSARGWNQSSGWKSGSKDGKNDDSNWGRSSWSSGSSDATRNPDSSWGRKSDGNEDGNQDSNWGKRSNWNSESGDANKDSGWGKKSNWASGNQSIAGGSGDQTESFSERASDGNYRGGFGARGSSDRGGFRGRGGFGGRGGDRGGFGGRGRERGGFGGRGRSDRGGFGGRSDRGGFGGRGRGRWDQSGGWNNRNDSSEDKPSDWNQEAGEGWKKNDSVETWNGASDKNKSQSWNAGSCGTSNQTSGWNSKGWNQPTAAKDAAGSGWNKGSGSSNEAGGSKGNNAGSTEASGGNQWSSWDKSNIGTEIKETNQQGEGGGQNLDLVGINFELRPCTDVIFNQPHRVGGYRIISSRVLDLLPPTKQFQYV
ncbi:hypothetical protein I3843_01G259300 [Carya illinoinensis]|nr:hypothetical protein I3843_01G259300 [Carya illinoinensis]